MGDGSRAYGQGALSATFARLIALAVLIVVAVATAGTVYASAIDGAAAGGESLTVQSTDGALTLSFAPSADNPAGMVSLGRNAVAITFSSNGTTNHGIQADSVYTYRDILRVKNTASLPPTVITGSVQGAAEHDLAFEFAIVPFDGTRCGANGARPAYAASPEPLVLAPNAEACLSVKLIAGPNATSAQGLRIPISALS